MKKKIYALMLVVAMVAMTLVGCGSDTTDTTNTTNDVNTETEESGEDVVVEPEVEVPETEVPEVESTEEPTTEEDEFYSDSYQWAFTESLGVEGFTDKFVLASDETMSFNCTHYVAKDGTEMNFSWVGPTALGEKAGAGDKTLFLYGNDSAYELQAWTYGLVDETRFAEDLEYSKETWTSFALTETPYVENGYYDIQTTDTIIKVVFEVANETQKGYNYYVVDLNRETCYQFAYLENIEIFDDVRAMNVINSIDFWTYNPGENTTE